MGRDLEVADRPRAAQSHPTQAPRHRCTTTRPRRLISKSTATPPLLRSMGVLLRPRTPKLCTQKVFPQIHILRLPRQHLAPLPLATSQLKPTPPHFLIDVLVLRVDRRQIGPTSGRLRARDRDTDPRDTSAPLTSTRVATGVTIPSPPLQKWPSTSSGACCWTGEGRRRCASADSARPAASTLPVRGRSTHRSCRRLRPTATSTATLPPSLSLRLRLSTSFLGPLWHGRPLSLAPRLRPSTSFRRPRR